MADERSARAHALVVGDEPARWAAVGFPVAQGSNPPRALTPPLDARPANL
jgi:hypothetical protein